MNYDLLKDTLDTTIFFVKKSDRNLVEEALDYVDKHNDSPNIMGYHGKLHISRCLNTLHYLRINNQIDFVSLDDYLNIVIALIFHDFGHSSKNGRANTDKAKFALSYFSTEKFNCTISNQIIQSMSYPYLHPAPNKLCAIARDCDLSMILYEDFSRNMFLKLIEVENGTDINLLDKSSIEFLHRDYCDFQDSVVFNGYHLAKILENNKDVIKNNVKMSLERCKHYNY